MPVLILLSSPAGVFSLVSCRSPSSPRTWWRLAASELFWTVRLKASRPSACDGGRTASRCTRAAACASCPTPRSASPAQCNQTRASTSVSRRTDTEPSWAKDPVSQSQVWHWLTTNRPYTDTNMLSKHNTKRHWHKHAQQAQHQKTLTQTCSASTKPKDTDTNMLSKH